ncbi:hypothetical protein HOV56_gp33 [Nitrosopumilus spindle-shaped virus]|uniref:C2H2-type domain-containing protein n=1 Tax=Nitrosopumilus spindle-shaped virus TaxID=2508184 RepID=A0A514K477_9VIRU|nr:hypothetical protein HOV56_gp33 [Nitrosopumilus spindle-shaped virus]YP_010772862.1 hypothetical protein QIT54_gp32 [Nitrosopumilus spindle-shaped virus]QDI73922.1 hypothetical protein [Nitrosopumilus spindle-shaped virus]QDI73970.1 hypothetical protein [Nitrosopumilus spindle-shaped virus]
MSDEKIFQCRHCEEKMPISKLENHVRENHMNECDDCYYNPQCRKCELCQKHCRCT